jgi:hypothetical protein
MNKLSILAVAMYFCYVPFSECEATEYIGDLGYEMQNIEYEGHTWISIQRTDCAGFELLHHPDCEKCYLDYEEHQSSFDDLLSCVQVNKGNSTYVVDNAGCVNF